MTTTTTLDPQAPPRPGQHPHLPTVPVSIGSLGFTPDDVKDVLGWLAADVPIHRVAARKACDPWHVEQIEEMFG